MNSFILGGKRTTMRNKTKGTMLILAEAFCFAAMSVFVRLAGDAPLVQKVLMRNLIPAIVSGAALLRTHTKLSVPKPGRFPLFLRIVVGVTGILCNYYAIGHMTLANSNSLNKLGPFFAILCAAVFLKERVTPRQWFCIAAALLGSLFIIIPSMEGIELASIAGLIGGLASGATHTSLRAIRRSCDMDTMSIVFIFSGVSTLIFSTLTLLYYQPMTPLQWLYMTGAGCCAALAQATMTAAYRYGSLNELSIFDSSQIIFGGLLGLLIFGQIPGWLDIIAYILIIGASVSLFTFGQDHSIDTMHGSKGA